MNSKTILLLSLPLALALLARGQEPVVIQKSVTNGNATTTMSFSSGGSYGGQMPDLQRMLEEIQGTAMGAVREGMNMAGTALGPGGGFVTSSSSRRNNSPALLTARPMDAETRAEWIEDLRVMDKLLRDQVNRVEGEVSQEAMGIRIWLTDRGQSVPQLLDDLGVVYTYEVSFPLAASGKSSASSRRENNATSAWDRARSELQGTPRKSTRPGGGTPASAASLPFEATKVDALIDALLVALVEAKNIRHLNATAAIFVTVSGANDAGTPVRLTLKTTRKDLDKAASGDATDAQLRKTATWTIQ